MSKRARDRKAAFRRERRESRARHAQLLAEYRAKRLPGESAREQLVRMLLALRNDPMSVVTIPPPEFKFHSVSAA